jgi:hypothetical protein
VTEILGTNADVTVTLMSPPVLLSTIDTAPEPDAVPKSVPHDDHVAVSL